MTGPARETAITIRPAVAEDAAGIALTFLESAEQHARLDPARYRMPADETIVARYREGRQHSRAAVSITLVAERRGEIVGFVDATCEPSPDPMHRDITFCHVTEIAVASRSRSQGIGGQLLQAVEDWGRQAGAAFAALDYHAANTRAGAFYQDRMGYAVAAITAIKPLWRRSSSADRI